MWKLPFRFLVVLSMILAAAASFSQSERKFGTPSDALAYVQQAIDQAHGGSFRTQKAMNAAYVEQSRRAKEQCSAFDIGQQHGDQLYALAKICRSAADRDRDREALQRYLSEPPPSSGYNPDARAILAIHMYRVDLDSAWKLIQTAFRADPIAGQPFYSSQEVIDYVGERDDAKARAMSRERWLLLRERLTGSGEQAWWVGRAAADLIHRDHLASRSNEAAKDLQEVKAALASFPEAAGSLHWAEMEMEPAPVVPALKLIGRDSHEIIKPGRVELLDFFFTGCAPCISSMPQLDEIQKRYPREKFQVIAVTTYKLSAQPDAPDPHSVDTALIKLRTQNARHISFAITSDEALERYRSSYGFPFSALIDKKGRLRLLDLMVDYDEGDPIDLLIKRLIAE